LVKRIISIHTLVNENVRFLERLGQGQSSPAQPDNGEFIPLDTSSWPLWAPMPAKMALDHAILFFIKNIPNRDNG
jgi:hypothetical protein